MTHFRVVYMRGREGKRYTCMYRVGSNVIPAVENCAEIITRKVLYIGHDIYFRMESGCQYNIIYISDDIIIYSKCNG